MGRSLISDETLPLIRDRLDIVDIVKRHVSLRKAGQNLKGLCPFHLEKTCRSQSARPGKFSLLGSGRGNVFTFLTRVTGGTFPEVVRDLGRTVGIEIEETTARSGPQAHLAQTVERVNEAAAAWF